jgi:hypothetical protein
MTALYEKISALPPSLLPMVERYIDSLPTTVPNRESPSAGENSKPKRRQAGFMKGQIGMADDFDAPMELVETIRPARKTLTPGCMKGKIWMADDFDAPMEEFEEYM